MSMTASSILESLILTLPAVKDHHSPGSSLHGLLQQVARWEVERLFSSPSAEAREFNPFGQLIFPYHKMGAIDSLDLFALDELLIFSFYWVHRRRYRRVLDIGANIGLHAILLDRCGYEVRAYEPDPQTFAVLKRNVQLNRCSRVQLFNSAVSSQSGTLEFVRVLGNMTGSHLAGSRPKPYGELERFPVPVESMGSLIAWADLIKLDVEGHEKEILLPVLREHWQKTDAFVEVSSEDNARTIYKHFKQLGVTLFSQKTNWRPVQKIDDMPAGYREGILFVTSRPEMAWHEA